MRQVASLGSRSAPGKLVPECHASSVETKNSCSAAVQIQRCFRGYQGRRAARHAQKLRNTFGMLNDIKESRAQALLRLGQIFAEEGKSRVESGASAASDEVKAHLQEAFVGAMREEKG